MRKQLYRIVLIDGTEFVETSIGNLQKSLKDYIVSNKKLESDKWYYLTTSQLNGLLTTQYKQPKFNYIKSFEKCYLDEVFGTINIKSSRENGEIYNDKYQKNQKNKELNRRMTEFKQKERPMDFSKFRLVC